MPQLPLLSELPPENLARLRALNPELAELMAPAAPEQPVDLAGLEAEMREAEIVALTNLLALSKVRPLPLPTPPPVETDGGSLVFRWAAATVAFIYILSKAGVFG